MSKPPVIIVCGMHRSGTSAISGALAAAGVNFGDNLIPAAADNPRGFFEDRAVVELNDQLLAKALHSWDTCRALPESALRGELIADEFERAKALITDLAQTECAALGLKDPRISLLIPFWSEVFSSLGHPVVWCLCLRRPQDVAHSLFSRNQFSGDKSFALWLKYTLTAADALTSDDQHSLVINYEATLASPGETFDRVAAVSGVTALTRSAFSEFFERGLSHATPIDNLGVAKPLVALAHSTFDTLRDEGLSGESIAPLLEAWRDLAPLTASIDQTYQAFAQLQQEERDWIKQLEQQAQRAEQALGAERARNDALDTKLGELVAAQKVHVNELAALRGQLSDATSYNLELRNALQSKEVEIKDLAAAYEAAQEQSAAELRHLLKLQQGLEENCAVAELERRHALELAASKQREAWQNHEELIKVYRSTSWRLSYPIRAIKRLLQRLR